MPVVSKYVYEVYYPLGPTFPRPLISIQLHRLAAQSTIPSTRFLRIYRTRGQQPLDKTRAAPIPGSSECLIKIMITKLINGIRPHHVRMAVWSCLLLGACEMLKCSNVANHQTDKVYFQQPPMLLPEKKVFTDCQPGEYRHTSIPVGSKGAVQQCGRGHWDYMLCILKKNLLF